MKTAIFYAALSTIAQCALACTPSLPPVVPDASDASPCEIADAATQARLIALPDGASLVVPCQ